MGAGRKRLIRQMLVESLLLSSIAGIAGVTLAWWMTRLLLELKPSNLPITLEVPLDWRVLLFSLLVSLATGLIFGVVPALRRRKSNAAPVLKEESQTAGLRKSRLRNLLLIGEIAACVVLLAAQRSASAASCTPTPLIPDSKRNISPWQRSTPAGLVIPLEKGTRFTVSLWNTCSRYPA